MKIDFNTVLKELDGTPMPNQIDVTQCPGCGLQNGKIVPLGELTLKSLVTNALKTRFRDEQGITEEEMFKRGFLAVRIWLNPSVFEPTNDEIQIMKKVVSKVAGPIVWVQVLDLLDPVESKKRKGDTR